MNSIPKLILPIGLLGSSLLTPCSADHAIGLYVKPSIGYSKINDISASVSGNTVTAELDSGISYGFSVGYDFGNDIRTEIGYDKLTSDFSQIAGQAVTGDLDVSTFSASVFKDFSSDSKFTPYLGVGLGTTNIDVGTMTLGGTSFAGSNSNTEIVTLTLGTNYEFNEGSNLFLEGNYRKVGDLTVSGVQYTDISTLGVNAGIKFSF